MAVVEMNKLRLVGLADECDKVLSLLSESGVFEPCPTSDVGVGERSTDTSHLDKLIGKQVKASFAIDYLSALEKEAARIRKKRLKQIKRGYAVKPLEYTPSEKTHGRRFITRDDLYDGAAKEYELLSVSDALEKISFKRVEIRSELARLKNRLSEIDAYRCFPLKFSEIKDTAFASMMLVFGEKATADPQVLDDEDFPSFYERYPALSGSLACVVVPKKDKQRALSRLAEEGFSEVSERADNTAREIAEKCSAEMTKLNQDDDALIKEGLNYLKYLPALRVLYDYLGLEIEKTRARAGFVQTKNTFVLEGWVPKDSAEGIVSDIKDKTDKVCAFLSEPDLEKETPPTLVRNPALIAPFEAVTNLYSPPAYGETDPNPFMAVFFFIFYGVMMADAGYGLIMTVLGLIALKVMKPEKGMAKLISIIAICGISAIAWGILFGGVFGIEGIPALWFNPIDEPLLMFGLSLGLGVVQIVFGYGMYAAKCFKKKKYFDGIIDVIFKITVIIGVGLMLLNILLGLSKAFVTAGIVVLIVSLVGIVATAGHAKPTVAGKIVGGFAGLYDLVNLVSDILSYARIFGLALASAAIALAFNTLGAMFFSIPVIGYVIGVILLIPLHAVNLGLGLLSGYVHNARLQFIEFYGKFYDGEGRLFAPMGESTKYVRFMPETQPKSTSEK